MRLSDDERALFHSFSSNCKITKNLQHLCRQFKAWTAHPRAISFFVWPKHKTEGREEWLQSKKNWMFTPRERFLGRERIFDSSRNKLIEEEKVFSNNFFLCATSVLFSYQVDGIIILFYYTWSTLKWTQDYMVQREEKRWTNGKRREERRKLKGRIVTKEVMRHTHM